tara:strand:- start:424 stop:912 length:489 start_codon:yes stop_codon:yes gene_type:complete
MVNYQYEWLGYNLKPLEMQSAILTSQLNRMDEFDRVRKKHYRRFYNYFKNINLGIKTWDIDDEVSPFSFPMLLPEGVKFQRKHLMDHLRRHRIECRFLFGGNLLKHPAYKNKKHLWDSYGKHTNSDAILDRFIMVGVSQVNTDKDIDRVLTSLDDFFKRWQK